MRRRLHYTLIIVLIVVLGLPTRMEILPLPWPVLKYGGGVLWSAMIYLILAWIFVKAKPRSLWIAALLIAWGIEFSQLYHQDALDDFRATLIGRMTIGRGFLWEDLVSYLIGVSLGAFIDWRWLLRFAPSLLDRDQREPAAKTQTPLQS